MSRTFFSAVVASAALHAAALAFVLLPPREEAAREFRVDVTWVTEATPSHSSPTSEPDREPVSASTPMSAHSSRRDGADREIAPQDGATQIDRPHPEEPIVAPATIGVPKDWPPRAAFAPSRDARETAPSRKRREDAAARGANSRHAESPRASLAPAPSATAAAEDGPAEEPHGGSTSLARTGELGSPPANSMAVESEIVYRVAPAYPMAARRRGIEGAVLLHVRFDTAGRPEEISVMTSSGSAMLDDAAREAVTRWRFRGGVAGALELPITFRLAAATVGDVSSLAHQGVQP